MNLSNKPSDKERLTLTLFRTYIDIINSFVEEGLYLDSQDTIRASLRIFFGLHGIEPFSQLIFPKGKITFPKGDEVIE